MKFPTNKTNKRSSQTKVAASRSERFILLVGYLADIQRLFGVGVPVDAADDPDVHPIVGVVVGLLISLVDGVRLGGGLRVWAPDLVGSPVPIEIFNFVFFPCFSFLSNASARKFLSFLGVFLLSLFIILGHRGEGLGSGVRQVSISDFSTLAISRFLGLYITTFVLVLGLPLLLFPRFIKEGDVIVSWFCWKVLTVES